MTPTTSTSGTPPAGTSTGETGSEQVDAPDGCACATVGSRGPDAMLLLALALLLRRRRSRQSYSTVIVYGGLGSASYTHAGSGTTGQIRSQSNFRH